MFVKVCNGFGTMHSFTSLLNQLMKLRLNLSLRAALMACYTLAAPVATTLFTGALVFTPQALAEETTDEEEDDSEAEATAAAIVEATEEVSYDLGNVMYVGDSITHGAYELSYRWDLHTIFVDNGLTYNSIGIMQDDYYASVQSPDSYGGVEFTNVHNAESGATAATISGSTNTAKFGGSNIYNWLGLSDTMADGDEYVVGDTESVTGSYGEATFDVFNDDVEGSVGSPDLYIMMIGTNDVTTTWNSWDGVSDITTVTGVANQIAYMDLIYEALMEANSDCVILISTIPVWPIDSTWKTNITSTGRSVVSAYNEYLFEWAESKDNDNLIVVDVNEGMYDITLGDGKTYGLSDMYNDGLHTSYQGNLIVAGNYAKALGYAGGTAGQYRKSETEFAVNFFTDSGSVDFVDSSNVASQGFTMTNTMVTSTSIQLGGNSETSTLYYAWQGDEGLSNGATVDFSISLGNGAEDGWNTTDYLEIIFGNDSYVGILTIDEAFISWSGSILYSIDMSSDIDNIRIAWVNGEESAGLDSGFYIWLDDMLIGSGLAGTSGSYSDYDGVTFTYSGDGDVYIYELSIDGSQSYAPTTTGITNEEDAYYAVADNPDGPSSSDLVWNTDGSLVWTTADATSLTASGGDYGAADQIAGDMGDLSIVVDAGSATANRIYGSYGSHTGDIWVEINSGAIANSTAAWYAAHGSGGSSTGGSWEVDGNVMLKFSGDATGSQVNADGSLTGSGASVLGAINGGTVSGSVYLEFSAKNLHLGLGYSGFGASVAGTYNSDVNGDMHMVFYAGTFDSAIFGGTVGSVANTIGGSTYIDVHGGTFNGNVYGGGAVGSIGTGLLSSASLATNVTVTAGTINANVYGGGTGGTISGGTSVSLTGGTITGDVYGGGTGGTITGSTTVTIEGSDVVLHDGTNWGTVTAGSTAGAISGNSTLSIKNVTNSDNEYGFDKFAGTLSGGTVSSGTRELILDDVVVSNFAAKIENFDVISLFSGTYITLTNTAGVSVGTLNLDVDLGLTIAEGVSVTVDKLSTVYVNYDDCDIINYGTFSFTSATTFKMSDLDDVFSGTGVVNLNGVWDIGNATIDGTTLASFGDNTVNLLDGIVLDLLTGLDNGTYSLFTADSVTGLDNISVDGLADDQKYSFSFDDSTGILSMTLSVIEEISWNGANSGGNWSDASWSYNGSDNTNFSNLDNVVFTDKGEAVSINLDVNASVNDMNVTSDNNLTIAGENNFTVVDEYVQTGSGTVTFDAASVSMNSVSITDGSLVMAEGTSFSAQSISMSNANLSLGEVSNEITAPLSLSGQNSITLATESASLLLNSMITYDTAWTASNTNTLSIIDASSVSLGSDFGIDVSAGFTVSEAGSYTILSGVGALDISSLDVSCVTGINTTTANNYIFSWEVSDGNLNLVATASDVLYYNPWKGNFYDIDLGEASSSDNTRTATTDIEGARLVINNSAGNSGLSSTNSALPTGKAYSIDICNTSNTSIVNGSTLSSYTTIVKSASGNFYLGGTLQADEGIFIEEGSIIYGNYSTNNDYVQGANIISDISISSGATLNVSTATYVANGSTTALIDMVGETGSLTYNSLSNATISNAAITMSGATTYTNVTMADSSKLTLSSTLTLAGTTTLSNVTLNSGASLTTAASANATLNGSALSYSSASSYTQLRFDLSITLGADSTLSQNTQYWLASSSSSVDMEVNINGSGTYELTSMLMRYTDTGDVTLNINDDATMRITNTKTTSSTSSASGAYSGFVTSGASGVNGEAIVNVSGTLELDSGIVAYSSGNGTINVLTGGDLVLNRGTLSYSNGGSITIDVEGGTVQLGNTVDDSYNAASSSDDLSVLTMNLYNGATIYGTGETFSASGFSTTTTTNVYQSLTIAESGTINMGTASGSTLNLYSDLNQGEYSTTLNVTGGTVNLAGGATLAGLSSTDSTATVGIASGSTVSIGSMSGYSGTVSLDGGSLSVGDSSLSNNIVVTADSTLSSTTGELTLNGAISYGSTYGSISAAEGSSLTLGEGFSLSISADLLTMPSDSATSNYDLITGLTNTDLVGDLQLTNIDSNDYRYEWSLVDGTLSLEVTESQLIYLNPYKATFYDPEGNKPTSTSDTNYTLVTAGATDRIVLYNYAGGNTSYSSALSVYSAEIGSKDADSAGSGTTIALSGNLSSATTITKYDESILNLNATMTAADGITITNGAINMNGSSAKIASDTTITGDGSLTSSYYSFEALNDATATILLSESGGSITQSAITGATISGTELTIKGNTTFVNSSLSSDSTLAITSGYLLMSGTSKVSTGATIASGTSLAGLNHYLIAGGSNGATLELSDGGYTAQTEIVNASISGAIITVSGGTGSDALVISGSTLSADTSFQLNSSIEASFVNSTVNGSVNVNGSLSISNSSFAQSISLAGGSLTVVDASLTADITVTAGGSSISTVDGAALTLDSTITFADASYTLDFTNAGELSIADGFGLDFSGDIVVGDYTLMSGLSNDISTSITKDDFSSISTDYSYTWEVTGNALTLSVAERTGEVVWDSTSDTWVDSDTGDTVNTDSSSELNFSSGSTESSDVSQGEITLSGDTEAADVTFSGDNDMNMTNEGSISSSTTITKDGDSTLTTGQSLSADAGISVDAGSIVLTGEGSLDSQTSVAEGASVTAGSITVTGTSEGAELSDGGLSVDTLTSTTVASATVEVTGNATLTGSTIDSDSTLNVTAGTLTIDETSTLAATTTLTEGTAVSTGVITVTGNTDDASIEFDEGSLTQTDLSSATVSQSTVAVTGEATLTDSTIGANSTVEVSNEASLTVDDSIVIEVKEATGLASLVLGDSGSLSSNGISGATVSGATITIKGTSSGTITGGSVAALLAGIASDTETVDSTKTFENTTLSDTDVVMGVDSTLTLINVTITSDTTFTAASDSTVNATDLTINVAEGDNLTISDGGATFTIDTFEGVSTVNVSGALSINLDLDSGDYETLVSLLGTDGEIIFDLAGVTNYDNLTDATITIASMDDPDEFIIFSAAGSESVGSSGDNNSSLVFTVDSADVIPEPSTATLSLLALAGLLARRRRKQA